VFNTTDNSERLRIINNSAKDDGLGANTHTWINVTTGIDRTTLIDLEGTTVLNYDVSGPAGLLDSTAVEVYITDSGNNATKNIAGLISAVTSGNARAGVVDLDAGDHSTATLQNAVGKSTQVTSVDDFSDPALAGTTHISVAFKITHAAGDTLLATEDYAIAADFCNFDQENSSLIHNCIYRLAAEETGKNTGIFEGTVEYITLNNSTSQGAVSGEHDGNDFEVEGLLTTGDNELVVVLNDSVSGADAIRVNYNDTDALGAVTKAGAQLDTVTHTGTVDLDMDDYEVDDMATITIVDQDLNQDSSVRDRYQNSSTTFSVTITPSGGSATQEPFGSKMFIIETSPDSGVFVGTFSVPNFKGADMEITYFESRDAGGNDVSFFDEATITSNSGTVSWDRSVYPVPFGAADLREGNGDQAGQDESGNVTAWITVSDIDETGDTLTTDSTTAAGTILVKLIESSGTSTCFTAGSVEARTTHTTTTTMKNLDHSQKL
jgi:hypothetical protein